MNSRFKIIHLLILILFFVLAAYLQSYKIGLEQIKIWDESYTATNALEMMTSKSYFIVLKDGEPDHYHTRPPLSLWAIVLSYKLFGITEFAVRFPTIVAYWMTMLIFVLFSIWFLKKFETAWIILALIATTTGYIYYHVARNGDPDTMLTFFVAGYFLTYFILLENKGKPNYFIYSLFCLSIIGAVYTKSIAGLVPLSGMICYTLISRKGRQLILKPYIHISWIVALIVILAYYIIRNVYDPGYLDGVYTHEINLFQSNPSVIKHPEYGYYFDYLINYGFKTYSYFIPVIIIPLFLSKENVLKRLILYSLICAVIFLLIHSMAVTKNGWYIAPIYPFLWTALATGLYASYQLLVKQFNNRYIKYGISLILVSCFLYFSKNEYRTILMTQKEIINPERVLYKPERAGIYLKELKSKYPEYKDFVAVTSSYLRQLQFYAKKFEYEDGTSVEILPSIPKNINNRLLFTCDDEFKNEIESGFKYRLLDSARYGKLYYVFSKYE